MPASSRAHLLLPTPLGLVQYDLLDEAAFLGTGPKGLHAAPAPFPAASVAVRSDPSGFVVRALPGEAPPDVNGAPADGATLRDGDRLRLGDQVALFRAGGGVPAALVAPAAAPPPAPVAPRPRRVAAPIRVATPPSAAKAGTALAIGGALLVVFAIYQAVTFLQTPQPEVLQQVTTSMLPEPGVGPSRTEEKATLAWEAARAWETTNAKDLGGAVDRYLALRRDFPGTPVAALGAARVTEIWPQFAAQRWAAVEESLRPLVTAGKYRRAVESLLEFDRRFAGTEAATQVAPRLEAIRGAARAALDGLKQRVAPLMATDSSRAYRVLTTAELELPSDMETELADLMARVRAGWGTKTPPPGPREPPREPGTGPGPGPRKMPLDPDPGAGMGGGEAPASGREEEARRIWAQAKADLGGKRFEAARKGFATLLKQYADTGVVAGGVAKVKAGRKAADVAMRGAAGLLLGDATSKGDRLEVEYQFDDDKAFQADFTLEQPFPAQEGIEAEVKSGMAILSGDTSMMLNVVFDPGDVTVEIDAVADAHQDYGLFALEDGKEYRAVAFDVGNTQFKLKKGAAATVLSGHVLWLYGEGVWRDADPGERGFVRIAEKRGNGLKPEERARVRLELHAGQVAGEIHAKGDQADLKGPLKGDDGRGIGPLRVGAFAFRSRIGVERFSVSGKVDAAWLAREYEKLVAAAGD
jgi:hypothetical protein